MNVFLIPSWYPEPRWGLGGGNFLEEFAVTLARNCPAMQFHVSLWGQSSHDCSSARLRAWLARPLPAGASRPQRRQVSGNLVEWYRAVWTWRYGFERGNVAAVLKACRAQLLQAEQEHGAISLLHAHVSFPAGYVAMELGRERNIPYVLTEHMSPFPFTHFLRGGEPVPEVMQALRGARRVIAVSNALAQGIRERTGVEALVIPNGVDETFFTPGVASGGGFTFLTVASLQPQKGIDDLLRAIARLPASPALRFRIAGDGAQSGAYRALAQELGVGERISWLGPLSREQVRDEMRACDAFVLTSRHESFGVVYAEAAACGKPVLATRCGGPEDIVHAANGVLVDVGDVAGIAAALSALARRERPFDPLAIRADFEARFASRTIAKRYASLYAEVAGAR